MILGALIDAGLSLDGLRAELSRLPGTAYQLEIDKVTRQGLAGTRVGVTPHLDATQAYNSTGHAQLMANHKIRGAADIAKAISASKLSKIVKQTSLSVLKRLVLAEARVRADHFGLMPADELYNLVTLIEIIGTVAGLSLMAIDRVECSPLHVGGGLLDSKRDVLPALAPLTAQILKTASMPIYGSPVQKELVSPVAAAILATIVSNFGPIPCLKIESLGYGAGPDDLLEGPNVVRVIIGETAASAGSLHVKERPGAPFAPVNEEWIKLVVNGYQQSGRQSRARG